MAFAVVLASAAVAGGGAATGPGIVGASAKQRALLRQILRGFGPTEIDRIRVHHPGRGWSRLPRGVVQIDFAGHRDADGRTTWQAWVLAGAFRDGSARRGLAPVAVYDAGGVGGDASVIGPPKATPAEPPARSEDPSLEANVSAALAATGPVSLTVQVDHPYGPVVEASLRVDDLARFLLRRSPAVLAALRRPGVDGWYVTLSDADEEATVYQAGRVGAFGARVPERLRGCVAFIRPGPYPGPPPCPA